MEDDANLVYFENILIFAETSNILRGIDDALIKEMSEYFFQYGWKLKVVPSKSGKIKFYFYGENENLIKSNLRTAKEFFKSITSDQNKLAHIDEHFNKKMNKKNLNLMNFKTLTRYLDAFAIHFNNYFKNNLVKECSMRHKVDYDILKFDPYSICLNGITLRLKVPLIIEDNIELDIRSIFSSGLEYISEFDETSNIKDRITRKKNEKTTEFIVMLRFSPKDRYSLRLSRNIDAIPDQGLYKGVNKIAINMFRYIRIHEYEKAQQRLTYEETKINHDKKTLKKIRTLRKLLEKYQLYQSKINVLEKTPDDKNSLINKLEKDISLLIKQLNKADFFQMCIISQRDFRVFELKVSYLISQVETHKENEIISSEPKI